MTASIQLGATYRDAITGFTGVATGYVQYISGCHQVLLSVALDPKATKDDALVDAHWFDVQRVEDTGEPVIHLENGRTPGSDKAAPRR